MAKENINVYNEDSIDILEDLVGVRKRPGMYIGTTSSAGLHHLIWEIIDNSIDEAMAGFGSLITVTIHKDGSLSVADEGRGIPTGIHKIKKIPAVELIFTTLHSGGKFSDRVYTSSAGLHGVGAAVTNALSEYVDVMIYREGLIHHIRFENGGKKVVDLEILGKTTKQGTVVRFKPDPKVFSTVDFKWETIFNHVQESAFLLNNVRFSLRDERSNLSADFYYENGLFEYISILNQDKNVIHPIYSFSDRDSDIKVEVAMQYCFNDYNEDLLSYVNNVRTRDGGTHENGFRTAITRAVNDYAENNGLLRSKAKLEGNDIREGLTAIISLRIPESKLEFEGQVKERLGSPEAFSVVQNVVYTNVTYYLNENKEIALNIIKKCIDAQNARLAARKAKEEARGNRKSNKQETILSDKLTPAQSKTYDKNELFIVEGDSAGGTAKSGRDRLHQAILPLRGKPLNTDNITMEQMMKNTEFATLINAIGAGVGQNFDLDDSKYGKIIIMTDADTDGAHIQTLLLTFFYHFMRPLITSGRVYIAVPPLYRVSKDTDSSRFVYAWSDEDLEKGKAAIGKGYRISRYKGLGEMNASQLKETTMDPTTRSLIRVKIDDPLVVERRIGVLMGKDATMRKKWVQENVDFTIKDDLVEEIK